MKQQRELPAGLLRRPGAASSRTSSARWARLSLIVPISVLLIFVLLFNAFGSVKQRGC